MSPPVAGLASPVAFSLGPVPVTMTVVYTWLEMAVLAGGSWLLTRVVTLRLSPGQNVLELVVEAIMDTIGAVTGTDPEELLALVGTLALFIAVANTMSIVPGLVAPTSDLSATVALAAVVFFAVPYYGIRGRGLAGYLRHYREPTWIMLPFNVISEVSRSVAMAVRLFGNVASDELVLAVLLLLAGLLVPVPILALTLLIGLVQAYIFAVLTLVYIGAVLLPKEPRPEAPPQEVS